MAFNVVYEAEVTITFTVKQRVYATNPAKAKAIVYGTPAEELIEQCGPPVVKIKSIEGFEITKKEK